MKKVYIGCLICFLLAFSSCQQTTTLSNNKQVIVHEPHKTIQTTMLQKSLDVEYRSEADRAPDEQRIKRITLKALGDLMVHRTQLIYADRGETFDFSPSFEYIEPFIADADYTFANLETTFADYLGQRRINVEKFYKGYSGYPCFNTPDAFATDLVDVGIDFVSTANNHSYDSKEEGILRTLDVLDEVGLQHTGTYRTEEEADTPMVIDIEGIRFGVINYTYGLNGFLLSNEDDYMVNHLNMYEEERIAEMNEKVQQLSGDVDFMVVMLHYGNEYRLEPDNYYQRPMVNGLFDAGADIILAGHPHVVQPIEVRELTRMDGTHENGVVIYSLGNFISSQRSIYNNGSPTDLGMVFSVGIEQVDEKKPVISDVGFMTTFTQWNDHGIQILPTNEIPDQVELNFYDDTQINRANNEITALLMSMTEGDFVLENGFYTKKINE